MTASQLGQFVVIMGHALFHLAYYNVYWVGPLAVCELLLMIQVRLSTRCWL